jgi:hypothetical protein
MGHPRVAKTWWNTFVEIRLESMTGYNELADVFGEYEDLAMFRCLSALTAKNLLYMQAELLHLERQLKSQIKADFKAGKLQAEEIGGYWKALEDSSGDGIGSWQRKKVLEIREKLKIYRE